MMNVLGTQGGVGAVDPRFHKHEDQAQDALDRPVVEKTAKSKPCGERLNPAFALQRHTAPTADVMVWGAIAYNTRPQLVLIRGTKTTQWWLPLIQRLPGAFFQQDNARPHTAMVSQDCLRTVITLPWPALSPDFSPIEHIWKDLGWRVGHSTSLNELEARL
ncbi:transposable element Tcb2 transposase [Trichonephila clavipes]|nr:transposable element Tcb2 transposase [Trichonephila clavipes]